MANILSVNCITPTADNHTFEDSGFDLLPGQRVHILSRSVKPEDVNEPGSPDRNLEYRKAHLWAFVKEGNFTYSPITNEDKYCACFYVRFEDKIWLRGFFDDAIEVIEKLIEKYGGDE